MRLCNIYGVGSLLEYGVTVWERDVIFKLKEMASKKSRKSVLDGMIDIKKIKCALEYRVDLVWLMRGS